PLARLIVVAEEVVRLAADRIVLDFIEQAAKFRRGKAIDVGDLEVHGQLHFVVVNAVHFGELGDVRFIGFADQDGIVRIRIDYSAKFTEHIVNFGKIIRVLVLDVGIAVGVLTWKKRIIVEIRIFKQAGNGIDPKAGSTAIEPESDDIVHGVAHSRIAPIKVG